MARSRVPMSAALLVALSSAAFAQGAAPASGEPSFLSGGLKLTVASIAVSKDRNRLSVALVIENQRDEGVLVAMLGHALAVDNRGNTFATREVGAVAGIAGCGTNMGAGVAPYVLAATPDGYKVCLEKVLATPDSYTTIDKRQSIVATLTFMFHSGNAQNLGNRFSFSSTFAVRSETGDALQGKTLAPARLISAGVPLIPVTVE